MVSLLANIFAVNYSEFFIVVGVALGIVALLTSLFIWRTLATKKKSQN